jgi:hypothetical protein
MIDPPPRPPKSIPREEDYPNNDWGWKRFLQAIKSMAGRPDPEDRCRGL